MHDLIRAHPPLPQEREYVRFVLAASRETLLGVYEHQCFCSRWATYPMAEVSAWCKLGDAPREPPPPRITSRSRSWSERPMREGQQALTDSGAQESLHTAANHGGNHG